MGDGCEDVAVAAHLRLPLRQKLLCQAQPDGLPCAVCQHLQKTHKITHFTCSLKVLGSPEPRVGKPGNSGAHGPRGSWHILHGNCNAIARHCKSRNLGIRKHILLVPASDHCSGHSELCTLARVVQLTDFCRILFGIRCDQMSPFALILLACFVALCQSRLHGAAHLSSGAAAVDLLRQICTAEVGPQVGRYARLQRPSTRLHQAPPNIEQYFWHQQPLFIITLTVTFQLTGQ